MRSGRELCSSWRRRLMRLIVWWRLWLCAASPEWIPMRILTGTSGMCRMWKVPTELRMFRDMLAISAACLLPFLFGRPDATM